MSGAGGRIIGARRHPVGVLACEDACSAEEVR